MRSPTPTACGPYLDTLFTAAEKSRICQFQRLLGLGALLPVILQPAELSFIYGKSLKRLLRAKIALQAKCGIAELSLKTDACLGSETVGRACGESGNLWFLKHVSVYVSICL